MSVIVWNCRGMGLPTTVRFMKEMLEKDRPKLVFLCETKAGMQKSSMIIRTMSRNYQFFVFPSIGLSGGLWLLWNDDCNVNVLYADSWIIHAQIHERNSFAWYFSGVYGITDLSIRRTQWEFLLSLKPSPNCAWLCAGDFNDIANADEKRGGRPVMYWQLQHFRTLIDSCEFLDMGFVDPIFTWNNKQHFTTRVSKRIDHILCNCYWRQSFPNAVVTHKATLESDHKILHIKLDSPKPRLKRPFSFEVMWATDPYCKELIKNTMDVSFRGSASYSLCRNLSECRGALIKWNHTHFGHLDTKLYILQKKLDECRVQQASNLAPFENQILEEENILKEYEWVLQLKDIHWGMKARHDWFGQGELNTTYFHTVVLKRRKRNDMNLLIQTNGVELITIPAIGEHLLKHYSELLTSSEPNLDLELMEVIQPMVSEFDNEELLKPVTIDEINNAIKNIGSYKAPSLDGFHAFFYKKFWDEVGNKEEDQC